jgi:hypothetical protein
LQIVNFVDPELAYALPQGHPERTYIADSADIENMATLASNTTSHEL